MTQDTFAAFQGVRLLRRGALDSVLAAVKNAAAAGMAEPGILIFDERSGRQVDFDLRGTLAEIVERANAQLSAKPAGRPRLGVSSREVTLLPRHWHWLERQRGGASAALRRFVEDAIRADTHTPPSVDPIYWQMSALAGDRPGFEEAARMLYAGKRDALAEGIRSWPHEIRDYLLMRVDEALSGQEAVRGAPSPLP
jgi:hypothetical protein